ncbi:CD2 antigen cytoplasmic tail-binding protein 2-like [Sycon ciliatum]|uniref:CD2 antigen cytoplasmic tail-binding protein 2-like n=1 Tax=Sycon ciliatum TaxID=27933 RepID=UPI0031F66423|eukprot:scpid71087/ scgid16705/ CD2 antigen cytoplasmic tail-binding protein 2
MATKRKRVAFAIPEEEESAEPEDRSGKRLKTFKDKHSLDSDEEDKADDTGELGDEDLAYHEQSTIQWDEDQKITPFNLDEEMEEGRFDAHGNYYTKDDADVADSWLESVNWEKVRAEEDSDDEQPKAEDKDGDDSDGEGEAEEERVTSGDGVYDSLKKLCELVKPGETVATALRRLGTTPARPKFRKGKPQAPSSSDGLSSEEKAAKRATLSTLTEIADGLVQLGRMSVYEETYEKFMFEIRDHENKAMDMVVSAPAPGPEKASSAVASGSDSASAAPSASSGLPSEILTGENAPSGCKEVCWHVKSASSGDSDSTYGPFSSTQMNDWAENGTFGSQGVLVRKAKDTTGEFYSSKRIDFDLYTD